MSCTPQVGHAPHCIARHRPPAGPRTTAPADQAAVA